MAGKVLKPSEWYNRKVRLNSLLTDNPTKLNQLKDFVDFLEINNLYMSVIGEGRDTENSSIYNDDSTDKQHWICDIKFFDKHTRGFATEVEIVGRESMNKAKEIYENRKFSGIIEELTGEEMQLGRYSKIKMKIDVVGFQNALDTCKKAISIYKRIN